MSKLVARHWWIIALQGLWWGCSLGALSLVLWIFDGSPNSDAGDVLAILLLVLTFPCGLVLAAAVGLIGRCCATIPGMIMTVSYSSIVLSWTAFVGLGYWQWFKAVPWLVRRIRTQVRRRRGRAPSPGRSSHVS